jgi:hypothetical protein
VTATSIERFLAVTGIGLEFARQEITLSEKIEDDLNPLSNACLLTFVSYHLIAIVCFFGKMHACLKPYTKIKKRAHVHLSSRADEIVLK